jgi:hypothetical protein
MLDEDGFICIDPNPNPEQAAQRVLSFAKVRGSGPALSVALPVTYFADAHEVSELVKLRSVYCPLPR